jgi:hypothetical protein
VPRATSRKDLHITKNLENQKLIQIQNGKR